MEKHIYQLLVNPKRSEPQNQELIQLMSNKYFKSIITPLPINQILQNIQIHSWPAQTKLFNQNQKLQSYYFLIQGSVNLYKKNNYAQSQFLQIVKNVSGPSFIGDSFFSHNTTRSYTAITSDSVQSKGFALSKADFEQFCGNLTKQYKILKNYLGDFMRISPQRLYKIDLYENIRMKCFNYGQKINASNQIFIIYEGQCLMSFQQKQNKKTKKALPYKSKTSKSQIYKPLLKLCNNECFGMQNIFSKQGQIFIQDNKEINQNKKQTHLKKQNQYKLKEQDLNYLKVNYKTFKYVATSEKLLCISINVADLTLFPQQLIQTLKIVHKSHLQKLKSNIQFNNSLSKITPSYQGSLHQEAIISCQLTQNNSSFNLNSSFITKQPNSPTNQSTIISNVANTQSLVKQKFFPINQQKSPVSSNHSPPSKTFRFPRVFLHKFNQNLSNNNSYCSRMNKTQVSGQSISPVKNIKINLSDIIQLKKRFCVGYDLKNKCDKKNIHYKDKSEQKQVIKQPKGYFPFSRNKNKQNIKQNSMVKQQRKTHQSPHKQWSYYIKLPKIIPKISKQP